MWRAFESGLKMEIFSFSLDLDILIVWVHKAEGGDVGPRVFELLHVHQVQVLGVIIIIIISLTPPCLHQMQVLVVIMIIISGLITCVNTS